MVAYKSSAVARFIKTPKTDCRGVLVYGPDAGLAAERASALAQIFARRGQGQTEIVRLDDRDLAEDRGQLEVALRTIPMFAEQSVVRVTAGPKLDVPALKTLLAEDLANFLIVEAGNLRPDSGLRKLFECHRSAVALPCYGDESVLSELIDVELARAGLGIDKETRDYLMTRLGADQALSRAEVVKLALYAQGRGAVSHDDIEAIVGDAAETALENFASTPCRVRHGSGGGAVRARPALHPASSRGCGCGERAAGRGGAAFTPAPAASQDARGGLSCPFPKMGRGALGEGAAHHSGGRQALAPLARSRRRLRRAPRARAHLEDLTRRRGVVSMFQRAR